MRTYQKHIGKGKYIEMYMSQEIEMKFNALFDDKYISVTSSNLKAIKYNTNDSTMQVKFLSGSEYIYFDVPYFEFEDVLHASSKGSQFYWNIRTDYDYYQLN